MSSERPPPDLRNPLEPLGAGLESAHFPALPRNSASPLKPLVPSLAVEPSENPWKTGRPEISKPRTKLHLRFIPPSLRGHSEVGVCTAESISGELRILDNTLVGFFLGKRPSFTYVRSNLLKQWSLQGSVETLQLLHGGIAFRFSSIDDRDKVLENGVFYVGGQPIFLRQWERNLHTGGMLGLKRVPLWVTLPGLPLHLWGEESLSIICSVLGKPLFSDRYTALKSRWAFARVCVEFVGDKPLLDEVTIEDDEGNEFLQQVKYEWRPQQCLSCGVFGHARESCYSISGAGKDEEECEKIPAETDLKDMAKLVDESATSTMMQNRTSSNTQHRRPMRVRKMNPTGGDPTQTQSHLQTSLVHSERSQGPEHVSRSEGLLGGPPPSPADCSLEKTKKTDPIRHFRQSVLNPLGPTSFPPSLVNRFEILETDADLSPSETSDAPSNSVNHAKPGLVENPHLDPSPSQPSNQMASLDPSLSQPVNFRPSPQAMSPNQFRPMPDKPTPNAQPSWRVVGRNSPPPSTPKPGPTPDATAPSSIGYPPYPSHISSIARTKQKNIPPYPLNPGPIFNSVRKNYRSFSSDLLKFRRTLTPITPLETSQIAVEEVADVEEGGLLAEDVDGKWEKVRKRENNRPLDQHSTIRVIQTWEDLEDSLRDPNQIIQNDEDVEDNIDDEENGLKEYENENEDSAEEVDDQNGKDKEEEDSVRRKRWTTVELDGDPWVKSTSLNDPRRIRIC